MERCQLAGWKRKSPAAHVRRRGLFWMGSVKRKTFPLLALSHVCRLYLDLKYALSSHRAATTKKSAPTQ